MIKKIIIKITTWARNVLPNAEFYTEKAIKAPYVYKREKRKLISPKSPWYQYYLEDKENELEMENDLENPDKKEEADPLLHIKENLLKTKGTFFKRRKFKKLYKAAKLRKRKELKIQLESARDVETNLFRLIV